MGFPGATTTLGGRVDPIRCAAGNDTYSSVLLQSLELLRVSRNLVFSSHDQRGPVLVLNSNSPGHQLISSHVNRPSPALGSPANVVEATYAEKRSSFN